MTKLATNKMSPEALKERNEAELLRLIARDSENPAAEEAVCELFRRYQGCVYQWCYRYARDHERAMDLSQEVFLGAYQSLKSFAGRAGFSSWLFAIARNKAIDRLRSRKEVSDQDAPENPDYDDPAVLLVRREDNAEIWQRARQVLPELQFQAVWLRYVEDMDVAGIAAVLGKTKTHVKVLLFRARRLLAASVSSARDFASTANHNPKGRRMADSAGNTATTRHNDLGPWTLKVGP